MESYGELVNMGPLVDMSTKYLFVYVFTFPVVGALTSFIVAFAATYVPRSYRNGTVVPECEVNSAVARKGGGH